MIPQESQRLGPTPGSGPPRNPLVALGSSGVTSEPPQRGRLLGETPQGVRSTGGLPRRGVCRCWGHKEDLPSTQVPAPTPRGDQNSEGLHGAQRTWPGTAAECPQQAPWGPHLARSAAPACCGMGRLAREGRARVWLAVRAAGAVADAAIYTIFVWEEQRAGGCQQISGTRRVPAQPSQRGAAQTGLGSGLTVGAAQLCPALPSSAAKPGGRAPELSLAAAPGLLWGQCRKPTSRSP